LIVVMGIFVSFGLFMEHQGSVRCACRANLLA